MSGTLMTSFKSTTDTAQSKRNTQFDSATYGTGGAARNECVFLGDVTIIDTNRILSTGNEDESKVRSRSHCWRWKQARSSPQDNELERFSDVVETVIVEDPQLNDLVVSSIAR